MCVNSYEHYSQCNHINTTVTNCPTHHKQQASARGVFGSIFRRSIRERKNCGKVIPHELRIEGYCQHCSIKKQQLRGEVVGRGALKVRKQGFQEIFQEERKEAARNALAKSERRNHDARGNKKSNHDIIHVENSVWLSDLYYHPETLARKEAYAREAALAPPIAAQKQVRNQSDQGKGDVRHKAPTATIQDRRRGERREAESRDEWMPAYGSEKPLKRPLPPAAARGHTGRFANNSNYNAAPGLPPAVGPPPVPQPLRTQRNNNSRSFASRAQATGYPDPRHKPKPAAYSVSPSTAYSPSSSSRKHLGPTQSSKAERQQDRNKMRQGEDALMRAPVPSGGGRGPKEPSRWETGKTTLSELVEKTRRLSGQTDSDSDVSFVCQTSRAISEEGKNKKKGKKSKTSGEKGRRHR
ncbi:hypothetical protein F5B22DRAFT_269565 [Xylaria bambusicola]|uniref:uncharacterized protein n=1 Tax=Xylaria bambusicola TaxID=326684 RepID=UPI0020077482|nr:uncharacterized protein F5B22DRAFT_269565 [Xylaria bambusicola]KAI0526123.1 hypothetical protein F5B22DRAFT_269565 [Xylaria bambusicola]